MYAVALLAVIEAAIRDLGDDNFEVREAASRLLVTMGDQSESRLQDARGSEDLEIAHRAKIAIKEIYAARADHLLDQYLFLPQIDIMLDHEPAPCDQPLSEARKTVKWCGSPWWLDYREATRLYLRQRAIEEESTEFIDPMVREGLIKEAKTYW